MNGAIGQVELPAPRVLWTQRVALYFFIALLIWAPFPLGSAVAWGTGLFAMLVAICCALWIYATPYEPSRRRIQKRSSLLALGLLIAVIVWSLAQSLPILPVAWANPLWKMTGEILDINIAQTVSINPWRTQNAALELAAVGVAGFMAYSYARNDRLAPILFNGVILIGATYVIYAYALAFFGLSQSHIIYGVKFPPEFISGPFMLHNSFATYCGVAAMASSCRLIAEGSNSVVVDRGLRRYLISLANFVFGRDAWLVASTLLLYSGIIASASRAGIFASFGALFTMIIVALFVSRRSRGGGGGRRRIISAVAIVAIMATILFFLLYNSDSLTLRTKELLDSGNIDEVRLALWAAAKRMISSSPWQGLGLGTFQDAYPLYATSSLAFVMDRAHSDYLELAAGLGVPAALTLLASVLLLAAQCLVGVFIRRRNRFYALAAFGASVLVALHSAVDFSLQIPAVALMYVTLLGIGVAQSQHRGRVNAVTK